jgi:hypothetical protein
MSHIKNNVLFCKGDSTTIYPIYNILLRCTFSDVSAGPLYPVAKMGRVNMSTMCSDLHNMFRISLDSIPRLWSQYYSKVKEPERFGQPFFQKVAKRSGRACVCPIVDSPPHRCYMTYIRGWKGTIFLEIGTHEAQATLYFLEIFPHMFWNALISYLDCIIFVCNNTVCLDIVRNMPYNWIIV